MPTYLMSYPGASWHPPVPEGGIGHPQLAFREWLTLCDAITRAGAQILVMPPPAVEPPLHGLVYASSLGHLLGVGDRLTFLLSRHPEPERQTEPEFVHLFLAEAGLTTRPAQHTWGGQADLLPVGGNRYIAAWGAHVQRQSMEDLRPLLPPGARCLEVELREPFRHGGEVLGVITNKAGDTVVLVHAAALADVSLEALRNFVGARVEVYPIDEADTRARATAALAVAGTLLAPLGLSSGLRGQLARRGFLLEEIELPHLLGPRNGPRDLVNELRGLVVTSDAPTYITLRGELMALADSYPVTSPPAAT
ncbi:MAG TPA: hypothetical protein VH877_09115 [Polyangia bacterium]|jgi:N-dimethylarginine dimethylaminohydrolase|nr:hypothetical protein [Polyangia bacterium]